MYKLIQTNACSNQLQLVSRRTDTTDLSAEAIALLKNLYGQQARIDVLLEADIAPETSGKYLLAQSLMPVNLDQYLDL